MKSLYFTEQPKERKLDFENIDVDKLVLDSLHFLDAEKLVPEFEKLGFTDGNSWCFKENWDKVALKIKWKFVAICALITLYSYEYELANREYEAYKENLLKWASKNPKFMDTYNELIAKEKTKI